MFPNLTKMASWPPTSTADSKREGNMDGSDSEHRILQQSIVVKLQNGASVPPAAALLGLQITFRYNISFSRQCV